MRTGGAGPVFLFIFALRKRQGLTYRFIKIDLTLRAQVTRCPREKVCVLSFLWFNLSPVQGPVALTVLSPSLRPGAAIGLLLQAALDGTADGASQTRGPRRGLQPERRRSGPGGLVGPPLPRCCESTRVISKQTRSLEFTAWRHRPTLEKRSL